MNQRRYDPKLLISPLLAAIVVLDAAAYHVHRGEAPPQQWRSLTAKLCLALAVSQIALAAIWTTLGAAKWAPLSAAILVAAMGWPLWLVGPVGSALDQRIITEQSAWMVRFLAQGILICLVIYFLRLRGLRLLWLDSQTASARARATPPLRNRLSLRSLLAWTIGLVFMLVLLRYGPELTPATRWGLIGELCVGHAAVALAALWAAMGIGRLGERIIALPAACAAAVLIHCPYTQLSTATVADYGQICLLVAALLLVPLWLFRRAGYRVTIGP